MKCLDSRNTNGEQSLHSFCVSVINRYLCSTNFVIIFSCCISVLSYLNPDSQVRYVILMKSTTSYSECLISMLNRVEVKDMVKRCVQCERCKFN